MSRVGFALGRNGPRLVEWPARSGEAECETAIAETAVFMKSAICRVRLLVVAGAMFCLALTTALAEDTNAPPAAAPSQPAIAAPAPPAVAPPAAPPAPVAAPARVAPPPVGAVPAPGRMPYGVEDVLRLTRAQITEDVVLNYVLNSGTVYNLGPQDIINLRNQGV